MERVENFVGGASMNIDTTINDILDNKYFFIIIYNKKIYECIDKYLNV